MEIYLDNNATTKVLDNVAEHITDFYTKYYGNPNSIHKAGTVTHPYIKEAIDNTYKALGADDRDDIIFTSCATESDNWILKSIWVDKILNGEKKHIVTTLVEHPAVLETVRFLEKMGVEVTYIKPDFRSYITADDVKKAVRDDTALVSVMWASNETGTIYPVEEIASFCKSKGVLFHTDAVQAIGKIKIDLKNTDIDFLTFSGHKFHAPKGVGGLYIKNSEIITPLLHGGEQMEGKRSGTLNVAGIVAVGEALKTIYDDSFDAVHNKMKELRDYFEDSVTKELGDLTILGKGLERTPNTSLISIRGVEGEGMLWDLNQKGIYASTGSACASESLASNPILDAIDDDELSHTAIRISLSRFTTKEEIDCAIEAFVSSAKRLRKITSSNFKG